MKIKTTKFKMVPEEIELELETEPQFYWTHNGQTWVAYWAIFYDEQKTQLQGYSYHKVSSDSEERGSFTLHDIANPSGCNSIVKTIIKELTSEFTNFHYVDEEEFVEVLKSFRENNGYKIK